MVAPAARQYIVVPKDLPCFGKGEHKDIEDFVLGFEKVLRAYDLDLDVHWERLLPLGLPKLVSQWVEANLARQNLLWKEAKTLRVKHYSQPMRLSKRLRGLFMGGIKDLANIRSFCDEFVQTMRDCSIKDDNMLLTEAFVCRFPGHIIRDIQVARFSNPHKPMTSVREVAELVVNMAALRELEEGDQQGSGKQSETKSETQWSQKNKKKQWQKGQISSSVEGKETSSSSKLHEKGSDSGGKTGGEKPDRHAHLTCFECKEKGHIVTNCPKKGKATNRTTVVVDTSDGEEVAADLAMRMFRHSGVDISEDTTQQPPKELEFPLKVNNVVVKAMLDTGADYTLISHDFCVEHGLKISKTSGYVQLGDKDMQVPRRGKTEKVVLSTLDSAHSVTSCLEVMVLPSDHAIVIGRDCMSALGILIIGLPTGLESMREFVSAPVADQKDVMTAQTFLPDDQREWLMSAIQMALDKNAALPKTGHCTVPEAVVHLPTPPGVTVYRNQYPIPQTLHPMLDEFVAKWLSEGVIDIAPVDTTWNNPLTLARKKDSEGLWTKKRPCLDPRPLNKITQDDKYPVPIIKDIFQRMAGAAVISTLDLYAAFHRFPIAKADQHKLSFTWNGVQYMFVKAPFGLKQLTGKFQRVMKIVFHGLDFVVVFVDDVSVVSRSLEDHAVHLVEVISRLTSAGLIINASKSFFGCTSVYLLGFVVSAQGVAVDPRKITPVASWERPKTGLALMHFLGVANYLREHCPLMATAVASLDPLRHVKDLSSVWKPVHEESFERLKSLLQDLPPLTFFDDELPVFVATDASNVGLGAVLYQGHSATGMLLNIVSFQARSLTASEKNYSATRRELLGIVFALQKFHCWIYGRSFTLFTDHQALVYMHSQRTLNPLLAGWLEILLDYDFSVVHRPGVRNVLPDHLSRLFPASLWEEGVVSEDTKYQVAAAEKYNFKKKGKQNRAVVRLQQVDNQHEDERVSELDRSGIRRDLSSLVPTVLLSDRTTTVVDSPEDQLAILKSWHEWGHYSSKALA
jgi:hypothetical protein